MARWGSRLWVTGLGVVLASGAFAAPARDAKVSATSSARAPSANEAKSNFLAKVQLYNDLASEMSRLANERAQSEQVRQLAKTIKADHHDTNGRITSYVLTRHVNLPDAVLNGEERDRAAAAMAVVQKLEGLNGPAFDREFVAAAQQVPAIAGRELMTARESFKDDSELVAVVDPLLQAMDQHRKTAESLSQPTAAARRNPNGNR